MYKIFRRISSLAPVLAPALLCVLVVAGTLWPEAWEYRRISVDLEREWWRIFSGHFAHVGWPHASVNLIGLLVAALIAPAWMNRVNGLVLAAYLLFGLGLALHVGVPGLARYQGLSGFVHGWLLLAFYLSPWLPRFLRLAVAVVIVGKIVFEHSLSFEIARWHGFYDTTPLLSEAHLYGAMIAVPAILLHLTGSLRDEIRRRPGFPDASGRVSVWWRQKS